jgi:DNA-binding NtrC family response regulator
MRAVYEHIDSVAPSAINVLILGETGVGKDIVAQALHARSGRRGPLVRVNCAALSASLLESELFGHERGAFTGAHSAKPGLLEVAAGGSAFLDEVGEMPLALQSTLLHAIETREVQRVGSVTPRAVDVRFIAATNRPLEADAASGRFRADLYDRLAGFTIAVPPLRERREDILPLAEAMLARLSARAGLPSPPQLNEEAERRLVAHAWPGNVRELRNVIERALLLANGRTIDVSHLPFALGGGARPVAPH